MICATDFWLNVLRLVYILRIMIVHSLSVDGVPLCAILLPYATGCTRYAGTGGVEGGGAYANAILVFGPEVSNPHACIICL